MKKFVSLAVILAMLFGFMTPLRAEARGNPKISVDRAIEIAKTAFNLNTEGYDFNQNYNENNERKVYDLYWNAKKQPGGSMSVSIDADTGEIINMYMWDGSSYSPGRIPKCTKADAQKVAEDIVKKLQPDKFKETKLSDKLNGYYGYDYYSDVYTFNFVRKANGLDFNDNGITVGIDKNTLKVRSYNLNWDNSELQDPSKAITLEDAKKIFNDKLGIELAYTMIYKQDLKKQVPVLVYSLKNGNMPIDAYTGDIIKNGYYGGPYYDMATKAATGGPSSSQATTPEEQKVIDISSKYITKEQAVEIAKKYLPLNEKYKQMSANLNANSMNDTASWYLYWENNDPVTNTYNYMNAEVDAINAEIKSFGYGGTDFDQHDKDAKPVYDKEQSRKIAEDFIKSIYPDRFAQTEYREVNDYYVMEKPGYTPPMYSFRYVRKIDGVTCNFDSITVNVNTYTGKVSNFYMNWTRNPELPSKEGTMSLDDAYKALYSKLNFSLKYIRYYDYTNQNNKPAVKLAYVLDSTTGLLDAKTGALLDYNGNPIKEQKTPQYTDIKGNVNEKNIELLAELGVLKDDSDKFRPNDKILQKDFIKLLILAADPYMGSWTQDNDYEAYYQQAISRKIISEKEKSPESMVTRQQAAKMTVKALGVGFIADLTNMYDVSKLKDGKSIPAQYKGYIAISSELKILTPSDGYFYPANQLTRGDAATIIVNFLKVDTTPKE